MIDPHCKNCANYKYKKCRIYHQKIKRPLHTTCLNFRPKNKFDLLVYAVGALVVLIILALSAGIGFVM